MFPVESNLLESILSKEKEKTNRPQTNLPPPPELLLRQYPALPNPFNLSSLSKYCLTVNIMK